MTLKLRPLVEFTCFEPILAKVVSAEVDHYPDPMVIMYSLDLLVLLYGLLYPSSQLDPTVENSLGEDQRSGMIVRSSNRTTFKMLIEFCNGNFSFGSGTDSNRRYICE